MWNDTEWNSGLSVFSFGWMTGMNPDFPDTLEPLMNWSFDIAMIGKSAHIVVKNLAIFF